MGLDAATAMPSCHPRQRKVRYENTLEVSTADQYSGEVGKAAIYEGDSTCAGRIWRNPAVGRGDGYPGECSEGQRHPSGYCGTLGRNGEYG